VTEPTVATGSAIDPITLEVFWSRLKSVVEEQATALIRSAFSPAVAEAGDISACAFDPRGYMIAQAVTGTPGHINSMARCMKHALDAYPLDQLEPGDVLITNDPWKASGHLNDVAIITPVFRARSLVAFFGNICHMADIGGRPFSADAPELYEEGIFIPFTKLFEAGRPNEELLKIVRANVREPEMVVGDFYAMTAANDVGAERLLEFMDEFRMNSIIPLADQVIERSESAMREAIRALPDGVYRNEVTMDGYDQPITLKVEITVAGDAMHVDYAGTSRASNRGINVVMNYTEAYTTFGIKSALVPDVPNNEGSFRPIRITAPAGSILNCAPPAPVAGRHIIGQWLPTVVHGALLPAIPDRVLAEGSSNLWNLQFTGLDTDGQPWTMLFFNSGGTGARHNKDGLSSTAFPSGVYGTPAEIIEARAPLLCVKREFRTDSGGPGKFRGGLGHWLVLRAIGLNRPYRLSPFFDRTANPAHGFLSGRNGALGEYRLSTGEHPNPKATVWLDQDTEIVAGLPGGGGFHDPYERDSEAVRWDVINELVSRERASVDYGVVLNEELEIDQDATARLRTARQ
jgi:N-methylhydantoinase B